MENCCRFVFHNNIDSFFKSIYSVEVSQKIKRERKRNDQVISMVGSISTIVLDQSARENWLIF